MSDNNPNTAELEQRLDEQRQEIEALRQAVQGGGPTRRGLMQGAGALGVGALLGGGASHAIDPVAADASTSDSDGDVGTPSNRLDVFADGVDTTSIDADELNGADISDTQTAERGFETDGNGGLTPVATVTDGDGTKRDIWVIANGASDPSGADPEDIIFEEES